MPLSVWEKLNLPDLTKTRMILELADRTIYTPTGIAEDVFVKTFSYNTIESVNQVDVIDVACEEFAQEVLRFLNISKSGNPTPALEPILSTSPPSLTPFEGVTSFWKKSKASLTNTSIPPVIDGMADFASKRRPSNTHRKDCLMSDPFHPP
ncbi:hypothetical protein Tco_0672027 [Tanacetum coccineum]